MAEKSNNQIRLTVVTPYCKFFDDMVDSCVLSVADGEMGFMAGHAPMIVGMVPGICHYSIGGETHYCVFSEGYAEINKKFILVICNSAEFPNDINATSAVDAYLYYKDKLNEDSHSKEAKLGLERALNRMKAIQLFGSDERKERLNELKSEHNIK